MMPILLLKRVFYCLSLLLVISSYTMLHDSMLDSSSLLLEICNNAKDDDGDGWVDLQDPDCQCGFVEPTSLIPNPSFEDKSCCPERENNLGCSDVWIQASAATTDYIHTCGYLGRMEFPPPMPFPDGEGVMGFRDGRVLPNVPTEPNYKEYAGACLLNPMLADSLYIFEFYLGFVNDTVSPPINITFFGTASCDYLPFGGGNWNFGCPTNDPEWRELASTFVSGGDGETWIKVELEIVPEETITAIAVGPACQGVESPVSLYYYMDNLILADFSTYEFAIEETNPSCSEGFELYLPTVRGNFAYQWYKDGIALLGETTTTLSQLYGEGVYQVRIENGEDCKTTEGYHYSIFELIQIDSVVTICRGEFFSFGDRILDETGMYTHIFMDENDCDIIVNLDLTVVGEHIDTIEATIFRGEDYQIAGSSISKAGEHLLTLESSSGCDSLLLLQLEYYKVFVPNIFSPNSDGINDDLTVLASDYTIISQHFTIYDRWGTIVYEGEKWNGKFEKEEAPQGVYLYKTEVILENNLMTQLTGSVMLIR